MRQLLAVFMLVLPVFLSSTFAWGQEFTKTKVAVMDFQLQGKGFESPDTGAIVTEWFINGLVKEGRFDVVERNLLMKMLKEQEIAVSSADDPSGAVRMGARLGVKIVITGYVVQYKDKMEVNARLIDVKTSSIIAAENVKERGKIPLETLVARLVQKVIRDFPVEGYIVDRDKNKVSIDLGEKAGVKTGMRFFVYKEGKTVKHPRTGQVLDVEPIQTGILKIEVVRGKISDAVIVEENEAGIIAYGQLVKSEIPLDYDQEGKVYVNTDPDSGKVRVLNIKGPYGVVDADRVRHSDVYQPSEGFGKIEQEEKSTSVSLKKKSSVEPKVETVAAVPVKKTISSASRYKSLTAKIRSKKLRDKIGAAKRIVKGKIRSQEVLSAVEEELLAGYQKKTRDKAYIEAMSWFCKALGSSGQDRYKDTLQKVIKGASNRKLRKYAKKSLRMLR